MPKGQQVVFFFKAKMLMKRMTVYFTPPSHTWIGTLTKALLCPFHTVFHGFDMENSALMRHVNKNSPSVLMRVFLFADSFSKQEDRRWHYAISATNKAGIKNSIIILHKDVMNNKRLLRKMKRNNNILVADMIDAMPSVDSLSYYSGVICCSHGALEYWERNFPKVPAYFIQHGVDPRIGTITPSPEHFSPYYFGAPENLLLFEFLKPSLNIVYTDYSGVINHDWHRRLSEANFHYAVRPPVPEDSKYKYKPFTKGFTAAVCNSNILVHASDGDALHYLGEDYPYLIKEDLCEEVVRRYMRQAKDDFGTERWHYGLQKMAQLRELCNERVIVKQFGNMLQQVEARDAFASP